MAGKKERKGKKTEEEALIILVEKKLPPEKLNKKDLLPQRIGSYRTDVLRLVNCIFCRKGQPE